MIDKKHIKLKPKKLEIRMVKAECTNEGFEIYKEYNKFFH